MRYGSVCSGIEAATVAWHPLGWKAKWYSEIEPFPSAVLAHHYPTVPNYGDMTQYKQWGGKRGAIDVLVGGTPCQSFSVAGLRKGLDDPRGNLMLTYLAIADLYQPEVIAWENVPGVLSSNGGRDFGTFLGALGKLGYGWAYRVLDAQYFGVAQRRRRVFVVGCLRNQRRAAQILFERHSLSGHPAPSRKTGKAAPTIPSRSTAGGGLGTDFDLDGGLIEKQWPADVACTLNAAFGSKQGLEDQHAFGGAQLFVPAAIPINDMATRHAGTDGSGNHAGKGHGLGIGKENDPMFTLTKGDKHSVAIPINTQMALRGAETSNTSREGVGIGKANDPAFTLQAAHHHAVAVSLRGREGGATAELGDEVQNCLRASSGGGDKPHALTNMQVRRLTPRECERLQGFPDDYTLIPWRKKPASECPDGPRYKALGNSMAVPVMHWIGKRIQQVYE